MGLLDFFSKIPTLNEISGGIGEWITKIYTKTIPDALVLHDVLIDGANDYTSQIDLILVGNRGVYVVEVKNFTDAKIYGDTKSQKWNYYIRGKKHEIYSPIAQNKSHVKYLKEFLKDFGDLPCFSVITMLCEDFKISGDMPINTIVCNTLPAMERGLERIAKSNPIVLTDATKQAIYEYIQKNQYIGRNTRIEHKKNVIEYNKQLEEKKKQKNCPYCKTELVLRNGKNGQFYGCKNFPKCRYTANLD